MDGEENRSPAVGDEHQEPVLPDAEGSSAEPCPYRDMLRYYRARRQFRFGRFLAPTRFPDDAWMRFTDDESVADAVYRNGRFGAILALELEATAGGGGDDEDVSPTMADDPEEPVLEFDRLLRMRHVQSHRFSAPTRFPPEHGAAYTTLAMMHETMMESIFIRWLGNGQPVPDGGAAAYRNGGFGAVPAAEEAIAALPETAVGEARGKECAVCLEAYETGDTLTTMPCAHAFHEHCIFGWLAVSRLCPLCRFAMPAAAAEETAEPFSFMGEEDDDHYGGDGEEEPGSASRTAAPRRHPRQDDDAYRNGGFGIVDTLSINRH